MAALRSRIILSEPQLTLSVRSTPIETKVTARSRAVNCTKLSLQLNDSSNPKGPSLLFSIIQT
jgi:hypothetical protein